MKFINGYENLYSVTINGEVYSHKSGQFLSKCKQSNGYYTVNLYKNGNQKTFSIHRLVANAFIENKESKKQVNHKDLDKSNNSVENLEWVTAHENILHAREYGIGIGEKNGNSRLNEKQILEIREKYKFRKYTYKDLANEYGVRDNYIGRIINKKCWKHI